MQILLALLSRQPERHAPSASPRTTDILKTLRPLNQCHQRPSVLQWFNPSGTLPRANTPGTLRSSVSASRMMVTSPHLLRFVCEPKLGTQDTPARFIGMSIPD